MVAFTLESFSLRLMTEAIVGRREEGGKIHIDAPARKAEPKQERESKL